MTKTLTRSPSAGAPDEAVVAAQARRTAAAAALGEAATACDTAEAAYRAALGEGREAARAAARHRDDAGVDRDVARFALEQADAELAAARDRAKAAKVQCAKDEALAKGQAFERTVRRELKAMTASARGLARAWAEAEIARRDAVRAGADPEELPEVEAFRAVPGLPGRELSRTRIMRWINPFTGRPHEDAFLSRITEKGDGTAEFIDPQADARSGPVILRVKAPFDQIVYVEGERGPRLVGLLEALAVPGVMADDPVGWSAPASLDPFAVLARLDELESAVPPDRADRRARKVRLERVQPELAAADPDPDAAAGEAA